MGASEVSRIESRASLSMAVVLCQKGECVRKLNTDLTRIARCLCLKMTLKVVGLAGLAVCQCFNPEDRIERSYRLCFSVL